MVENLPSSAEDSGSIPGPRTKIPHAAGQVNHNYRGLQATAFEPVHSIAWALRQEESTPQLEKTYMPQVRACAPQRRPSAVKIKINNKKQTVKKVVFSGP